MKRVCGFGNTDDYPEVYSAWESIKKDSLPKFQQTGKL